MVIIIIIIIIMHIEDAVLLCIMVEGCLFNH